MHFGSVPKGALVHTRPAAEIHDVGLLERLAALAIFAAGAPVLAGSALCIAWLSDRSPFIAHLRVGQYGKPLWTWKLRTMWAAGESKREERGWIEPIVAEGVADLKEVNDSRVRSRFAAFCRRHSIDELPQLLHVVRGEMSLVGPRPLTRTEITRHYGNRASNLLAIKPGLTGLWQVQGRSDLTWEQRVILDLALERMMRKRTFKGFAWIGIKTIAAVFSGKGAR